MRLSTPICYAIPMIERGPHRPDDPSGRNEPLRNRETILTQDFVALILQDAREHLRKYDGFPTSLFALMNNGKRILYPLSLPETHDEKCAYFGLLGFSIRDEGRQVREAILVAESWYVGDPEVDSHLELAPSQHPNRKEAITLVGRDSAGLRTVFAIQPFSRDSQNKPIFEPLELDQCAGTAPTEYYSTGLLDYLFFPAGRRLH